MKRLYRVYLLSMVFVLTITMMMPSSFAVDAVAVIGAKLSNNQHKVDQAWDWLRRIWIAWVVINGIGAFIAYIAPKFSGLATLTP